MSPPAALSPNAVRSLVEQHRRFLRFVQRRVGSRDEAEEILQDALATGLARGGSLRDEVSVIAATCTAAPLWRSRRSSAFPRESAGALAPGPTRAARTAAAGLPDLRGPRLPGW